MSTFITHPNPPPPKHCLFPLWTSLTHLPHPSIPPPKHLFPSQLAHKTTKTKATMRPSPCLLAALTGLAAAQDTGTDLSTSTATTTETASVPPYSTVWVVTSTTTTVTPSATLAVSPTSSMFPFFVSPTPPALLACVARLVLLAGDGWLMTASVAYTETAYTGGATATVVPVSGANAVKVNAAPVVGVLVACVLGMALL